MPWSSDNRPIIVPPSTESLGKRNHDLRNRSTGVYQQYPFFAVGTVGAFATMFVGATGPLVAPFAAAANKDRQGVVATHAILMTIQHSLKVVAFGFLGFAFGPYIPLLIGLIACGFAGTWTGRHILNRLPEKAFRIGLKTILTLLALRLLYGALADLAL